MNNFLARRVEAPSFKRKFGDLKTSIFSYLTPWMLGLIILVALVVVLNFEAVKHNFTSGHVALNGTILAVFFAGVLQACYNNVKLWYVARYLTDLDGYMDVGKITYDEYMVLQRRLEKSASLINIKTTFNLLDNLYQYGNLLIRDKDAIMIKSKLGYRVRTDRSSVSFLTGILVMFGLIGTFWGLLETISSVASALNDIAASSSGETSAEEMDMGAILSAISGPLKGMGLAFSASLFGLSGSLLLGFFMHITSDGQNKIIEDISRWIDDRIPSPDQNMAEKGKELKGEGLKENSNLEAWLATYAFLARRTEQNLVSLFESLSTLTGQFDGLSRAISNLDDVQSRTNELLQIANQERGILTEQYEKIVGNLSHLPTVMTDMNVVLKGTKDSMSKMLGHSEAVSRDIAQSVQDVSSGVAQLALSSNAATKTQADQLAASQAVMERLRDQQSEQQSSTQLLMDSLREQQELLLGFHTGLIREIKEMSAGREAESNDNARGQVLMRQSIEEQVKISRSTAQNSERLELVLGRLQTSLDNMAVSLNEMGGTFKDHQSGIIGQMDQAIKDLIAPLTSLRKDIAQMKSSEPKDDDKKKSPFSIFGKK